MLIVKCERKCCYCVLHCSHRNDNTFSWPAIQTAVEYFTARGFLQVVALVPEWRATPTADQNTADCQRIIQSLLQNEHLSFTPSGHTGRRKVCSYDDRLLSTYYIRCLTFDSMFYWLVCNLYFTNSRLYEHMHWHNHFLKLNVTICCCISIERFNSLRMQDVVQLQE